MRNRNLQRLNLAVKSEKLANRLIKSKPIANAIEELSLSPTESEFFRISLKDSLRNCFIALKEIEWSRNISSQTEHSQNVKRIKNELIAICVSLKDNSLKERVDIFLENNPNCLSSTHSHLMVKCLAHSGVNSVMELYYQLTQAMVSLFNNDLPRHQMYSPLSPATNDLITILDKNYKIKNQASYCFVLELHPLYTVFKLSNAQLFNMLLTIQRACHDLKYHFKTRVKSSSQKGVEDELDQSPFPETVRALEKMIRIIARS